MTTQWQRTHVKVWGN